MPAERHRPELLPLVAPRRDGGGGAAGRPGEAGEPGEPGEPDANGSGAAEDTLAEDARPSIVSWLVASRWRQVWALVALAAVVTGLVISRQSPHHFAAPPSPTPFAVPSASGGPLIGTPQPALRLGPGEAVDVVRGGYGLVVLYQHPARLLLVSPGYPSTRVDLPAGAARLTYDGEKVWVISPGSSRSVLRVFDGNSLDPQSEIQVPFTVTAAAGVDGNLWLGGPRGLYELPRGARTARRVTGSSEGIEQIGVDPARNRVLATRPAGNRSTELMAVDATSTRIVRSVLIPLSKVTLAVTVYDVWVAGFGGAHQVLHLDKDTLRASPRGPTDAEVGPGATVWAGETVIWIRAGNGTATSCIDAGTGETRARWPALDGPVISRPTTAYAIDHGTVVPLPITRACFPG